MSFFGNLLNSIPVVGHAKGVLHYVCGDEEGGDKAILAATRAAAVVGAGAVGALAGPVGAIAAGAAAGAVYDTGAAIVTDGKQVAGIVKIFENPGDLDAWVDAGVEMAGDGLAGVVAAGGGIIDNFVKEAEKKMVNEAEKFLLKQIVRTDGEFLVGRMAAFDGLAGVGVGVIIDNFGKEAGKKMAKKSVEHGAKKEAEKLVAGVAALALKAGYKNCREPARASGGRRKSTADYSSKKQKHNGGGDGGGGAGGNQGAKGDADKGTSGDPDDRRDGSEEKKKECQGATTQQLQEFIRIVEVILAFVRNTYKHWRCLETINRLLQEFIEAAIPLMNDPTVRLTIRDGTLEMCINGRVLISIEHHLASFLSLAIQQHSVGETSRIDYPCSQESCEYCPNLRHAQTEWTGNCQTRNVIYSFRCRDCHQMVYVGQTTRPLRLRMGQHLRNFNSALHRHIAGRPPHHRNARTNEGLLEIFEIVIMWRMRDVDTTDLDHEDKIENIRNWEVLMQWLTMSHKSLGGESKR